MAFVVDDLRRWGPDSVGQGLSLAEAKAYSRELASTHYENFPILSWAVPPRLRQHFANVYAFCRWADDLGDEIPDGQESLRLLDWWQNELEACFQGNCRHPVFVALKPTIDQFQIPKEPFSDLISAFVQDQSVAEYETFDDLLGYCRRSADPVGRIVLYLAERVSDENFVLSDSICSGLQLANFWQDVARDADIGRCYIPREDRTQFGYTEDMLANRKFNEAFRKLIEFEVERTGEMLLAGRLLVSQMPGRLKCDIDLFIRGGLLVLRGIERIGYDVWKQRPVVTKRQLLLAGFSSIFTSFLK